MKYAVDSSKLRSLGWRPKYTLERELPAVTEWFKVRGTQAKSNAHIRI